MYANSKIESAKKSLDYVNEQLINVIPEKLDMFFQWVSQHCYLFIKEQSPFLLNEKQISVTSFNEETYNYLCKYIPNIMQEYYFFDSKKYVRNSKSMLDDDATKLYCSLYLKPRNVIWVDFGFNVGNEFGGKHPAIILKNINNSVLIVVPISSNANNKFSSDKIITFSENEMFNMPSLRKRFTNITRMLPISVHRIDINSSVGSISLKKYQEILDKIRVFYKHH